MWRCRLAPGSSSLAFAARHCLRKQRPSPLSITTAMGDITNMTIGLEHFLTVAAILFVLGIFGIFLNRKNVIVILMSVELILLSVNLNLVAFSAHLNDLAGQVFTMFILTVAAAEAAIGLAILVVYFRNRGSIEVEDISTLKG
jgi:NADH-quinone oxidoreductase subunit K